jgi:hypothetical protein
MAFLARCHFCPTTIKLPDTSLGASIQCPRCRNQFTAAPQEETSSPAPHFRSRLPAKQAGGGPSTPVTAVSASAVAGQATSGRKVSFAAPTAVAGLAQEPDSNAPGLSVVLGVTGFFSGGLAILLANSAALRLLTIPLAALGLLLGVAAAFVVGDRSARAYLAPAAAGTIGLAVLLLALAWPEFFGRAWFSGGDDPSAELPVFIPRGLKPPVLPDEEGSEWMDAAQGVWKQGDVQLRVLSVQVGRVPLKGAGANKVKPASSLVVRFRVRNQGAGRAFTYEGWAKDSKGAAPTLKDDQENTYALRDFGAGVQVSGQVSRAVLAPGSFVDDLLVFEPPEPGVEALFLELPAAALGGTGSFKLRMNRADFSF